MSAQTKKVRGQLLDPASRSVSAEVSVEIAFIQPQDPNDRPQYRVAATVEGYRPEWDNKSHILSLSEKIAGEVFISINGVPDTTQTRFTVFLQDPTWNSLDWFHSL